MLTHIEVKAYEQETVTKKIAELMAQAHKLGYDASMGALRIVPVDDRLSYCQTVWYTPQREKK